MLNSDSKELRIFVQRIGGGGVSKAVWPGNRERRTSSTTWRRYTTVSERRWIRLPHERHPLAWAGIFLLMAAIIAIILVLHSWSILLVLVGISTILTVAISLSLRQSSSRSFFIEPFHLPRNQSTPPQNTAGIAMMPRLLKTSRPATLPLVRVLETFDLSNTDVEHFLETTEESNAVFNWSEEQTVVSR